MAITRGITASINIVELESKIEKIVGTFDYINYSETERTTIEEKSADDNVPSNLDSLPLKPRAGGNFYPDRWITIKIKSNSAGPVTSPGSGPYIQGNELMFFEDDDGTGEVVNRRANFWKQTKEAPNVFFTQDFVQGYVRITPNENQSNQQLTKIVLNEVGSKNSVYTKTVLSYLKNNLSGSSYISVDLNEYEQSIKSNSSQNPVVLDPNTNLPISETAVQAASSSKDTYINSHYLDKIVSKSYSSPMIWSLSDRDVKFSALITDQLAEEKGSRKLSSMRSLLNNISASRPTFDISSIQGNHSDTELEHWGWHAVKYVRNDDSWSYVSSFVVDTSISENHEKYPGASDLGEADAAEDYYVFKDPYVLYGKTYKYEIRDAWIIKQKNDDGTQMECSFLLGTQTSVIEVDCQEKLPPLTPSNFSFKYVGENNIRIEWLRNKKFFIPQFTWGGEPNHQEFEANDVGGYLLFIRNSLSQPYKLHTQFHITKKFFTPYVKNEDNDWYPDPRLTQEISLADISPSIIGASVPNDNIVYIVDSTVQSFDFEIRSNTDYYVAMCTYDVHGNISNYSEQFFLRRNNVTGEVQTSLISSKGASLAYPNALIPTKFVLSSLKVSGYPHMNIYQTPDTSTAFPTNGDISIQLIDLNTENSVVITGVEEEIQ